jgi:uncharacterized repeat protein (TIGR03803 family)
MPPAIELSPIGGGAWTQTLLHKFADNGSDGFNPLAGLIPDASGNLYGTTSSGGAYGYGAVFELAPAGGGSWTETILHSFDDNGTDGFYPLAGLIFDGSGNLYGTTELGGSLDCGGTGCGTLFELTPQAGGTWTETVLYVFHGTDGNRPYAGLTFGSSGSLSGTTQQGGANNYGTAFDIAPVVGGGWTETALHSFNHNGKDGILPYAGVIFDVDGNLYGTTSQGGTYNKGTVFEIAR